jgi:hypothetical protein
VNYSNSQRAGVIFNYTASLFGTYFTVEQIALATRKTVEEVKEIIDSNQAVLV